ncbi:MAG: CoA-binding protein [Bdellovibrionota bacterium]
MPTIAVVGASSDRKKYGNKCVRAYLKKGWTVYPVNPHESTIEGQKAYKSLKDVPKPLDRVAYYLHPEVGVKVLPDVAAANPKDLFLNPGTESPEVVSRAEELDINAIQDCAIVAIGELPGNFK